MSVRRIVHHRVRPFDRPIVGGQPGRFSDVIQLEIVDLARVSVRFHTRISPRAPSKKLAKSFVPNRRGAGPGVGVTVPA
jgi:hypothetical protein